MSKIIRKDNTTSIIMYHRVCPEKYRRAVLTKEVDEKLKEICQEIEKRFEIKLLEIRTEQDDVHFLVQTVPRYSPAEIVQKNKSITAQKLFEAYPEVKKAIWGGVFWTRGYYIGTEGGHGDEEVIGRNVRKQGREAEANEKLYEDKQLGLFE